MHSAGFLVAGTHSGCGKTSVALGIMAALLRKGLRVQPFKVGPDFIDPGHHTQITGRQSYNLDGWMLSPEYNLELFSKKAGSADLAVIEGVMGLFDGFSGNRDSGSSSQIAKWLDLPVLLVVDAQSMARSAAAVAWGYSSFDRDLDLSWVVFNRVGSPGHKNILQEAMQYLPEIEVLGFLPWEENIRLPSRHLGLVTQQDLRENEQRVGNLVRWIDENISWDPLTKGLECSVCAPNSRTESVESKTSIRPGVCKLRMAVAWDEAFCFYYPDNLGLLEEVGFELIYFSPIRDSDLPSNIAGLYLGGGYPELSAADLSQNQDLISQIRDFAQDGGTIYAECGGFMYLMQELEDVQGVVHPMAGVFALQAKMEKSFKALGYREIETREDSILGPAGTRCRGHEFHYSSIRKSDFPGEMIYNISDRKGQKKSSEGYCHRNVLGSYIHLHWGSNPQIPRNLFNFLA